MYPWRPTQAGWTTWTRWPDRSAWPQWPPCLRQGCPPWVPSRWMTLLWGEAAFSLASCLGWTWLSRREMHHGNTADTEGSWLLLSSADWAHLLKTLTNLESCVSSFRPNRPAIQPCPSKTGWRPSPSAPPPGGAACRVDRWSAARVRTVVSLFTAFTLVQLRSLLQSKCWQADFTPVSDWMYLNVCI